MKPSAMPGAKRRPIVLLVQQARDDALQMYADFLSYHGVAPIAACNASDARVLAGHADIVVTGIMLDGPDDGIDLITRLRAEEGSTHTPVIVLTACSWSTDRERAEQAGCDVFLPKPCLPIDLLREVRRLLCGRRRRRRARAGASAPVRTTRKTPVS